MSVLRRLVDFLKTPSRRWSAGALLAAGTLLGILLWGGFNWSLELTNTERFCISCHEMEQNVYMEYRDTIHYNNRSGVRATCPDCHVPREWQHKVLRKIRASNELFHKIMGSVATPEKFEAKRLELARHVWKQMKDTDSRECRNCHDARSMDYMKQQQRAAHRHEKGFEEGKTCIDCHKGIAHSLPALYEEDPSAALGKPHPP
ncbi:MAG TPA: NapC/NirT family cytochrome c [Methylococcaceae bacterium]|nr:NapC/NirT family cytochrome c [Methylococcaceae bacterium]